MIIYDTFSTLYGDPEALHGFIFLFFVIYSTFYVTDSAFL